MSAENPADTVIEQAAKVISDSWTDEDEYGAPGDMARALHDAGLLADPAGRDEHGYEGTDADGSLVGKLLARAERAEAERDRLRAQVAAVRALAEGWHSRGTHDMEFSKQVPEDVQDAIYESGVEWVEKSRLVREALDMAGGEQP